MRNRKTSLDANHKTLVASSLQVGYSVYDGASVGGGASDLIVANRKKITILFEVKNGEQQSYFYLGQLEYLARWVGYAAVVKTFDDIQKAMNEPDKYCLSEWQKTELLKFVETEKRRVSQKFTPSKLPKHKVYLKRIEGIIEVVSLCSCGRKG